MAVSRHNLNGEILSAASQLGSLFQKFSFQPIRLKLRYGADPAGRGMPAHSFGAHTGAPYQGHAFSLNVE